MNNKKDLTKKSDMQIAWYPTIDQEQKIKELKKELLIEQNSELLRRSIGELYNKTFPNKSWF